MGLNYLSISAVSSVLSFVGLLQWWTKSSVGKLISDGSIGERVIHLENAGHALEPLLGSYITIALLANFALNIFILLILCLKTIFFVQLYPSETRKVVERLVNYVIYKGTFLPLVVPPTIFQAGMWSTWLTVLCSLKMFQALARDRLERLNASPSATPWTYFRVFSVLLLVFSIDIFCQLGRKYPVRVIGGYAKVSFRSFSFYGSDLKICMEHQNIVKLVELEETIGWLLEDEAILAYVFVYDEMTGNSESLIWSIWNGFGDDWITISVVGILEDD
ncbi:hypothetical protein HHK36_028678 [Tetracentron sinense]|uniref:E3 ubiquitin-protein ligase synoviolin-like TPR repeats domain-containing protein n=1 Tax=Tetracentron sinense TaxID=13715 RepID=A0A834YFU4_TETSI|nr:hypothetical protein HHK36_028678 [Tetracentron sinense]